MKGFITRRILIAKLAALALGAFCFLQAPVRAQGTTDTIIFPSVGVTPEQKVSFTLFNPNGTPVRAQVRSHHPGGAMFLMGDGSVRAGAFDSFVIEYSAIPLQGDERTGRKQILSSVKLTFSQSEAIKPVLASMEIIDVTDGTSNTLLIGETLPSRTGGDGNDIIISGFGNDTMMGLVPGQKALVTAYLPSRLVLAENGSYEESPPIRGHVKVFDSSGYLIAQSPELVIKPGESGSFGFDRNALPILGEPGTNRAQVRMKPFFTFESKRLSPPGEDRLLTSLVSFEVVDNRTGKTLLLTGSQCLVFN
jgi:prepilin-type processing-associated H-X9-DG protein